MTLFTDYLILVSEADRKKVLRMGLFPPRRISVIRNGIDSSEFEISLNPRRKKQEIGANPDQPMAIMVGNLRPQKAPEDFVRAAVLVQQEYGPVRFILVGDGPLRYSVESAINESGIQDQCRILGYRSDISELLAASDVFVLPSIYEGLSISILEAMASGLPVVTTEIAENQELVRDGINGLLVPIHQPELLAQAIVRVLTSPEEADTMGRNNRERVKKYFSVTQMVFNTDRLYYNLFCSYASGMER